jgi:antitoxin component of MazEF toxin-antitoxin module
MKHHNPHYVLRFYHYYMAIFKTKLIKWGNSVGIIIPKPIMDTLNFTVGDDMELIDKDNYVILRKSKERK